ncbi:MAG: hypothetical protein H0T71_01870 [Acidobacteria bacterium]|nr:hypothetical protein [Acidobacteriota bacterium]
MNLLAPITPSGWSSLLPEWPVAAAGQPYEGFQYLGAGNLLLLVAAMIVVLRRRGPAPWRGMLPIVVTTGLCALYALSPRVTLAGVVLMDWSDPALEPLAIFRATGRFFWPLSYLLLAGGIGVIVSRLARPAAIGVLCVAATLQAVDLRKPHGERRATSRSEAFHGWRNPLPSPEWHQLLPNYDDLVIYPARQCGTAPIGFEGAAYLAALHGVTINSAEVARYNEDDNRAYCDDLASRIGDGVVDRRTIYLMDDLAAAQFQQRARLPLQCRRIDAITACSPE